MSKEISNLLEKSLYMFHNHHKYSKVNLIYLFSKEFHSKYVGDFLISEDNEVFENDRNDFLNFINYVRKFLKCYFFYFF